MATHEQVWVKVNAPVDKGVSDLIRALSEFPKLQTIESCEELCDGCAWVTFNYGDPSGTDWKPLATFVFGFLGPQLMKNLGDRIRITVEVTTSGFYRAEMAVQPSAIPATVKALSNLKAKFVD